MGCIMVVLIHYIAAFFPAMYNGDFLVAQFRMEKVISNSPLYAIFNGSFAVYIFWCISAYLIAENYNQTHNRLKMTQKALKKYFAFLLPVFLSCVLVYVLMKNNCFFNKEVSILTKSAWLDAFFDGEISINGLMKAVFWDTFFSGNIILYNPVLWSMKVEFIGSLITIALVVVFGDLKYKNYIWFMVGIVIAGVDLRYLCFLIGIVCSDLRHLFPKYSLRHSFVLLLIGLFGAGYPAGYVPQVGIYSAISAVLCNNIDVRTLLYCISAGLILSALVENDNIAKIFSNKLFLVCGENSLYIYLLHLIIECSLGCWLFKKLYYSNVNYLLIFIIVFTVANLVTFGLAKLASYFIKPQWDRVMENFIEVLTR